MPQSPTWRWAEFAATATAKALVAAMAFEESGSYRGEFYFHTPVRAKADSTAREVAERLRLLLRHRQAAPASAGRRAR